MEPEYQEEETGFWSKFKNNFAELIEFIAILGAIFIATRLFVAEPHIVSGNSMFPNFHDKDYLITNKLVMPFSSLKRGMVIILQNPANPNINLIKRIISLPGEKIKIFEGKVLINGKELPEPYLPKNLTTPGESYLAEGEEITIPEGQYFVMGDNRGNSTDSRALGPISLKYIIGQAFLRYWPLNKFQYISLNKPSV